MRKANESIGRKQAALYICTLALALAASFYLIVILGMRLQAFQADKNVSLGIHEMVQHLARVPGKDATMLTKSTMGSPDASQVDALANELSNHPTTKRKEIHEVYEGFCQAWDQKIWELAAQVDLLSDALGSTNYGHSSLRIIVGIFLALETVKSWSLSLLYRIVIIVLERRQLL